jgi:hypothetical protein
MWNGRVLSQLYPQLFSFTINENITLFSVLELNELEDLFHLPLSEEAYTQFCDLNIYMQAFQQFGEAGQWKYIWGNGHYISSKAYKSMIGSRPIHLAFKWIWFSACQQKHKIFFWLLLKNRLNTRSLLKRKNMQLDSYDCELCLLQKEEKLRHLFFKCSFARNC